MLSKALAVANNAVLLDNAQNIEGAIEAYAEACDLLQQVLIRSSVLDDRKRLSDIRNAYSKRIADLHDLDDSFSELMEKALPEDPPLDETNNSFFSSDGVEPDTTEVLESVQIPPRQESLLPEIFGGESYLNESSTRKRIQIPSLAVPMDAQYMPPPLSPRRPPSPISERDSNTPLATRRPSDAPKAAHHTREGSSESTSWLDTLEDGDSSTSRSSRLSSLDFGIQNNHNIVDDFEAEFDAALDAAVDAAYDDNLTEEPTPRPDKNMQDFNEDFSTPVPAFETTFKDHPTLSSDVELTREYDEGDSSEEEERLLEEMTKGFVFDDFSFDNKSKSALPRQSDSSTFSGRTWTSSLPSTTTTNITTLSTLAESQEALAETSPRPLPPAKDAPLTSPPKTVLSQAPPLAPPVQPSRPTSIEKYSGLNIRERRFSGRSGEQLKIETFARRNSSTIPIKPIAAAPSVPELDIPGEQPKASQTVPSEPTNHPLAPITPMTTLPSNDSVQSESPATPALTQGGSQGSIEDSVVMPPSPAKTGKMGPPAAVKKNLSSSSLRVRNLSVATTETSTESPITPVSAGFGGDSRKVVPPLPSAALPTPLTAAFGPQLLQTGGMYLFDDITATGPPRTPRSPEAPSVSPPQLLEPCPESFLLRPFWLMRCLYQTLAHPSGGYLTTKLFIPRDAWKVRNVKLKALDDKVSQCDLLTAALLKLAKVDTFDADSVLDELQSFEVVLDQVRNTLQKKMGSDVGFSGSSGLFKSVGEDQETGKSTSTAAKSIASSWRKLRSKSSAPAMGHQSGQKDGSLSGPSMASLPMTSSSAVASSRSHLNRKIALPPTPTQLANVQPVHAAYMSSLARLFDAAQVLDGIARQVEDPGLKCSNKTQVGLELGVKNAAEFFAFFIIRFVMADLMLMVDKFLKRGSEWVLS
ncbi:MIT microtubule interacting and transport domain-containing protein [Cladophialophora immunda]|nr:MIT microtubule interacting and transport domain-containing protein [Cladophialophora immunda]